MEEPATAGSPAGPRWFARLVLGLNAVGTALIFGLMLLINSDVVGRAVFNSPVRGTAEIVAMSIVAIVFLQLPHALAAGKLIRSDVLIERLERARPGWARALNAAYEITGAVLFAAIAYAVSSSLSEAWEIDAYVGAQGDFTAPIWPVYAVIVLGASLTAVQYLFIALERLAGPAPQPAAVVEGPIRG